MPTYHFVHKSKQLINFKSKSGYLTYFIHTKNTFKKSKT